MNDERAIDIINLLSDILAKLEEIRCGLIDVETAIQEKRVSQ